MSPSAMRHADAPAIEARIGEVLKRHREQSGLSLRTLAARAAFSASFLSQLENGQVSPSIGSLERIAAELGISLSDLFEASQAPTPTVVRATSRPGFSSSWSRARVESLTPSGSRRPFDAIAVTLAPRGTSGSELVAHGYDQFAYVLDGTLTLFLGHDRIEVQTGDAVGIPRRSLHRWQNDSAQAAQVLLLSTRFSQ